MGLCKGAPASPFASVGTGLHVNEEVGIESMIWGKISFTVHYWVSFNSSLKFANEGTARISWSVRILRSRQAMSSV